MSADHQQPHKMDSAFRDYRIRCWANLLVKAKHPNLCKRSSAFEALRRLNWFPIPRDLIEQAGRDAFWVLCEAADSRRRHYARMAQYKRRLAEDRQALVGA
jgi:hypothetical protein